MDRRSFLGVAGTASSALLVGCLGSPGDSAGGSDGGRAANGSGRTDGGPGASSSSAGSDGGASSADLGPFSKVSKWTAPPPDPPEAAGGYWVSCIRPARVLAAEGGESKNATRTADEMTNFDWGRYDPQSVDLILQVFRPGSDFENDYRVVLGSFDAAAVGERLAEQAHEQESYEGFDIYGGVYNDNFQESYQDRDAYAVGAGAVVESGPNLYGERVEGSVAELKRVLDVAAGDADSYLRRSDALRSVASRIDLADSTQLLDVQPARETNLEEGTLAGATARGVSDRYDGRTAQRVEVYAFESADAAAAVPFEGLVSWTRSRSDAESVTYSVDGAYVTVESTVPAARLL